METFTEARLLQGHILARVDEAGRGLFVGVEGGSLAGKTTVARRIADGDRAIRVSTDCYRRAGVQGERHTDGLEADVLQRDLAKLRERFQLVVVEGICLRDTLDALAVPGPELFVYVKRVSPAGVWPDDPAFGPKAAPSAGAAVGSRVDWWSADYHRRRLPHESCDVVYTRVERAGG